MRMQGGFLVTIHKEIVRMAELMQAMGYWGKVAKGDNGGWVESAANGNKFHIYGFLLDPDDPNSALRSIQFDGGWGGLSAYDAGRLLPACNQFNFEWRFAKAAVSSQNGSYSLGVKLDHYCPNGLTDDEFYGIADMYVRLIQEMEKQATLRTDSRLYALVERHNEAVRLMYGAETQPVQAVNIYLENARSGYGGSMKSLGNLYEQGAEVSRSIPVAAFYFTQAAERGQPSAYLGLARVLSYGDEDEAVLVEATKFALLACRDLPDGQNKWQAEMLRDKLMQRLDHDAQETAAVLACSWKPLIFEGGPLEDNPIIGSDKMSPNRVLN